MRVLGVSKLPPARPRGFCSAFGRGGGIEKPRLGSLGTRQGAMLWKDVMKGKICQWELGLPLICNFTTSSEVYWFGHDVNDTHN